MAKNNIVKALQNQGFAITSDATWFNTFGYRGLYAYGKNVDSYCGGYHRAFDFVKYHNAPIKSMVNGTVLQGTGWNTFGWTVVIGFSDHNGKNWQMIIGHLNTNPLKFLKVGQRVRVGDVIGYQGASNNLNVTMASHIHVQVQSYAYRGEWAFTCDGVNIYNIDITTTKSIGSTKSTVSAPAVSKNNANRGRSLSAYMMGNIDYLGAEVRKRSGSQSKGFNWSRKAGYSLNPGDVVYIFEVHNGWGRIYTGNLKGHGSNDWIWLGRLQVTKNFK